MSVRHVLETAGVEYGANMPLRIAGGSARIVVWNQIRADVTGLNLEIVEQGGAVTLGAATLTALGVGLFSDLREASSLVRIQETITPRREHQTVYGEQYDRFRKAYQALRILW